LSFSFCVQEICDNPIDDDLDGLIDELDPDCQNILMDEIELYIPQIINLSQQSYNNTFLVFHKLDLQSFELSIMDRWVIKFTIRKDRMKKFVGMENWKGSMCVQEFISIISTFLTRL